MKSLKIHFDIFLKTSSEIENKKVPYLEFFNFHRIDENNKIRVVTDEKLNNFCISAKDILS